MEDKKVAISKVLRTVGVPVSLAGYRYLRRAIELGLFDYRWLMRLTGELYPKIAEEFNTTSNRVERAMRHAIETAWDRGDISAITSIFGGSVSNVKGKPTNKEFICTIVDEIQLGCPNVE